MRLMRFWLFGTFMVVFAAITAYIGIFTAGDWWTALRTGFPIWGLTGFLCLTFYLIYFLWLWRKRI
ncbi:MAG: hypothetical protein A2Y93_07140 [Chloroflexi bacterium RBG_13_68_17]|nr:MAG: hypothetical protein A2Y93_07140 [Chloroflexi bacterium RBG_13_68_17]